MERFKEFLQSSTIHGLVYLTTTRGPVRLLWLGVVIAGFSGAGVLIYQSFADWAGSPVSTTIETLPITKLEFPNVTVCPPRNTFTSLNPDLVMARNFTFSRTMRNDISSHVPNVVLRANYDNDYNKFFAFNRGETFMNWYLGITKVARFERKSEYYKEYQLETTSISGSVSTPSFKQPFNEELFEDYFYWNFHLHLPVSLSVGTKLVIDIEYDLETSFNQDSENIQFYWKNEMEDGNFLTKDGVTLRKTMRSLRKEYLVAEYHDGNT